MGKRAIAVTDANGLGVPATTAYLIEDPGDTYHGAFERRARSEHLSGEHALAFAVLVDPIHQLLATPLNRRRFLPYQECLAWLTTDDPSYAFSFVSLCEYLNLDAAQLRQGVLTQLDLIAETGSATTAHILRRSLIGQRGAPSNAKPL